MINLDGFLARRELEDWRCEHTLIAARVLNQTAAQLVDILSAELKDASWRDGLIGQSAYIRRTVDPRVIEVSEPIATRLVEDANRALAEVIDHRAVWAREAGASAEASEQFEGWTDVASGVAPLVGGAALAAIVPGIALTTTGGLLGTGLLATTVVSWPIAVVGGAAAATAISTGLLNTARIWDKTETRLQKKVVARIAAMLVRGNPEYPSVLDQLSARYSETVRNARRLWC